MLRLNVDFYVQSIMNRESEVNQLLSLLGVFLPNVQKEEQVRSGAVANRATLLILDGSYPIHFCILQRTEIAKIETKKGLRP